MRTSRKLMIAFAILASAGPAWAADVGGGESLVVTPPEGRVGQRFDITCKDFPQPASSDYVYIVKAGTPDINPVSVPPPKEKVLWGGYAANCYPSGNFLFQAGPFAPGTYEVRFATTLYNNDGRVETSTRTSFMVH